MLLVRENNNKRQQEKHEVQETFPLTKKSDMDVQGYGRSTRGV
jgi:hypothetical protein